MQPCSYASGSKRKFNKAPLFPACINVNKRKVLTGLYIRRASGRVVKALCLGIFRKESRTSAVGNRAGSNPAVLMRIDSFLPFQTTFTPCQQAATSLHRHTYIEIISI